MMLRVIHIPAGNISAVRAAQVLWPLHGLILVDTVYSKFMHGDLQQQLNYGACWTGTASSEPDSPPLTKQAAGCSAGESPQVSVCVWKKERVCPWNWKPIVIKSLSLNSEVHSKFPLAMHNRKVSFGFITLQTFLSSTQYFPEYFYFWMDWINVFVGANNKIFHYKIKHWVNVINIQYTGLSF